MRCVPVHSRKKCGAACSRETPMLGDMKADALKRAARITVNRSICERFPPGPVRDAWLASVYDAGADSLHCHSVTSRSRISLGPFVPEGRVTDFPADRLLLKAPVLSSAAN